MRRNAGQSWLHVEGKDQPQHSTGKKHVARLFGTSQDTTRFKRIEPGVICCGATKGHAAEEEVGKKLPSLQQEERFITGLLFIFKKRKFTETIPRAEPSMTSKIIPIKCTRAPSLGCHQRSLRRSPHCARRRHALQQRQRQQHDCLVQKHEHWQNIVCTCFVFACDRTSLLPPALP
jgi:hypothetical protein